MTSSISRRVGSPLRGTLRILAAVGHHPKVPAWWNSAAGTAPHPKVLPSRLPYPISCKVRLPAAQGRCRSSTCPSNSSRPNSRAGRPSRPGARRHSRRTSRHRSGRARAGRRRRACPPAASCATPAPPGQPPQRSRWCPRPGRCPRVPTPATATRRTPQDRHGARPPHGDHLRRQSPVSRVLSAQDAEHRGGAGADRGAAGPGRVVRAGAGAEAGDAVRRAERGDHEPVCQGDERAGTPMPVNLVMSPDAMSSGAEDAVLGLLSLAGMVAVRAADLASPTWGPGGLAEAGSGHARSGAPRRAGPGRRAPGRSRPAGRG